MDLQSSWDMPYGRSLGEMIKAVHQILKALLKRAVLSQGARSDRREEKCKLRQQFLNGQLIMKPAHPRCPRPHNIFSSYPRQALSLIQKVGYSFYRHHIVSDNPLFSVDCCMLDLRINALGQNS